jgi:hypothetical protein
VKYWVNVPLGWKFEPYSYWGDDLNDFEGTVSSRCQFSRAIG